MRKKTVECPGMTVGTTKLILCSRQRNKALRDLHYYQMESEALTRRHAKDDEQDYFSQMDHQHPSTRPVKATNSAWL